MSNMSKLAWLTACSEKILWASFCISVYLQDNGVLDPTMAHVHVTIIINPYVHISCYVFHSYNMRQTSRQMKIYNLKKVSGNSTCSKLEFYS